MLNSVVCLGIFECLRLQKKLGISSSNCAKLTGMSIQYENILNAEYSGILTEPCPYRFSQEKPELGILKI